MRNGYYGILRSIALVAIVVVGFNIVGAIISVIFFGLDVQGANSSILILINSIAQVGVMFTMPVVMLKSKGQDLYTGLRLEGIHDTPLSAMLLGVPIIIVSEVTATGLAALWTELLKYFPDIYDPLNSVQKTLDKMMGDLTVAHSGGELLVLILGISLIPAIVEETFFRGFIQTNIERSGKGRPRPMIAIIITSLLFGAMHMSPLNFPALAFIGAVLGWLAYRTCDLRVSVLAHAMNNGIIVLVAYFFSSSHEAVDSLTGTPTVTIEDSLILIGMSLPILFGLLYVFQKITEPLDARHNAAREIAFVNRTQSFSTTEWP